MLTTTQNVLLNRYYSGLKIYLFIILFSGWFHIFAQEKAVEIYFSHQRGFYEVPFELVLTPAALDADIWYSFDGSLPSPEHGIRYSAPIPVHATTILRAVVCKERTLSSAVVTQTYIFLDDVIHQPANPEGFPPMWQSSTGESIFADYEMNPSYPDSSYILRKALQALPSISIVLDAANLFSANGFYTNGGQDRSAEWEKPASIEFLYPDEQRNFQENAGVQPRSHSITSSRKRGMKIDFKNIYGVGRLEKPILADAMEIGPKVFDNFNSLVLRSGFMENYTGKIYNMFLQIYFRDPMVRDAQLAVSGYGTHNIFVHLYLNGLYWGIYNLTESIDTDFLIDYWGGTEADWLIAKDAADSIDNGEIVTGDPIRYYEMLELIADKNLGDPKKYQRAIKYLDPVSFADYMIIQNFYAVGDWPDNNWIICMKNSFYPEPARILVWDAEKAWLEDDDQQSYKHARYSPFLYNADLINGRAYRAVPSRLWRGMITNADFRMLFADRVYKHLFNNGPLTNQNTLARFNKYVNYLTNAVRTDQKRWSDDDRREKNSGFVFTHEHWQNQIDHVRQNIQENVAFFIADFQAHGLYPAVNPPEFSHETGRYENPFTLKIQNPELKGVIYYTFDGSDPRGANGIVSPTAFSGDSLSLVNIQTTQIIKARILYQNEWSPLHEALFQLPTDFSTLKITEIMYHPPDEGDIDGDEFEFIELKNTGSVTLGLAGIKFTNGIDFSFPDDRMLAPSRFIILAKNRDLFFQKYHLLPDGIYSSILSNSGERITLTAPNNQQIFSVKYDDKLPWPIAADGLGYSLVPALYNENPDPDNPANWRASKYPMGSPWQDDSVRFIPPDIELPPAKILFITASDNLNKDDQAVFNRLQLLELDVTIRGQHKAIPGDVIGKNLIIISESVSSSIINSKFRDVQIPVLLWESYLYDDMGMTFVEAEQYYGVVEHAQITVMAHQHIMAAQFSGTVQVSGTIQEMSWGRPNENALAIAHWNGDSNKVAIFIYEKGSQMPGLVAPEKRIGFYFKNGLASEITPEGWQLFDAAVQWATGKISGVELAPKETPIREFLLLQNFPNPFNPSTQIVFYLPESGDIRLKILNLRGQLVRNLIQNNRNAGKNCITWDGRNETGEFVSNGIYFYRLIYGHHESLIRKMILIK